MDPFSTIKDSSIWQSSSNFNAFRAKDPMLRIAIVKKVYQDSATTELRYLVTMFDKSDEIELNCRLMRRFGGVFNYEDIVYQGYTFTDAPDPVSTLSAKAGDIVLVAFLNGEGREGIILGGIMHAARISTIDIDNGPQYMSEFNGMQTIINQNGEYILTFRGIPTNISVLNNIPSTQLPVPTYDTSVGSSFLKIDQTGSLELNDNSSSGIQNIRIDKSGGFVIVNAGSASLKMTKSSQEVDLTCEILNINASTSISQTTDIFSIDANSSATITTEMFTVNASISTMINSPDITLTGASIELIGTSIALSGATVALSSPSVAITLGDGSVAIGSQSVDLLTEIVTALQDIGNVQVAIPPILGSQPYWTLGPLNATAQWSAVATAIANIQSLIG